MKTLKPRAGRPTAEEALRIAAVVHAVSRVVAAEAAYAG